MGLWVLTAYPIDVPIPLLKKMKIENLIGRNEEIIRELNTGNTENLQELLSISFRLYKKYEPCNKCGFISKNKETKLCKICLN